MLMLTMEFRIHAFWTTNARAFIDLDSGKFSKALVFPVHRGAAEFSAFGG